MKTRSKDYNDAPSWNRRSASNVAKKRRQTTQQKISCRSSSTLFLPNLLFGRERAVGRGKGKIVCSPQSVEMAVKAASPQGEESNKLLFMLALGLFPNLKAPNAKKIPCVKLVRDPQVEAEAKRKLKSNMRRQIYEASTPRPGPSNPVVEVIDLVSSDEESDDEDSCTKIQRCDGESTKACIFL